MSQVAHHRLTGIACVVVGALLSVGAIGAQTVATALIRRDVAPPSSDFTTYVEGEIIQVSIPSNWRELPASNAVTFAPDGAYGNAGVKSVFTHGVGLGLIRNDKDNLQVTTNDFIESQVLIAPGPRAAAALRQRDDRGSAGHPHRAHDGVGGDQPARADRGVHDVVAQRNGALSVGRDPSRPRVRVRRHVPASGGIHRDQGLRSVRAEVNRRTDSAALDSNSKTVIAFV